MRLLKIIPLSLLIIILLSVSLYAIRNIISDELILTERSQLQNLIRCYKTGNNGKKIFIIGCIHGNEKAGVVLSLKVLNEIFSSRQQVNTLICIPTINPDGNVLNIRTNSHRIDINRNFPANNWEHADSAKLKADKKSYWGGKSPASEIETRFILKIDSLYKPDALIILHQFMDCVQYDGTGVKLAGFIAERTHQKLLDNIGYKTPGSIGSYFGDDRKREVVTIEIPENPPDSLSQNIISALVDVIKIGYIGRKRGVW